jgi:hypothetical protein
MAITPLPAAPSRSAPSDFSVKADAFIAALPVFVTEANAVALAMNLNALSATSTTSLTIGLGNKSLTVDASKSFLPGQSVSIAYTTTPTTWMHGIVVSYNSGTGALVVSVDYCVGSGTQAEWTITYSSPIDVTVKTNLLTNSQWMAMSGSTLEDVGSNLITGWTNDGNNPFETFTTSGASITSAINSSGTGQCYASFSTVVGKLYKVVFTETFNSGSAPNIMVGSAPGYQEGGLTISPTANGANSFVFEAVLLSSVLSLQQSAATNFSLASVTLYEVTPGYVAADTLAPDGWRKGAAVSLYRQHKDTTYTKDGSFYSLKSVSGTTTKYIDWGFTIYNLPEFYSKFAGKTVTFGIWCYCATASHARLNLMDSVNTNTRSSYHSGAAGWEWLEVTLSVPSATTHFLVRIEIDVNSTTAYFSQPMLVFGSSIGEGNYQPIPNEVIWLRSPVILIPDSAIAASKAVNVEASTGGSIGKGVVAFPSIRLTGLNATIEVYMVIAESSSLYSRLDVLSQVSSKTVVGVGSIRTDYYGDLYLYVGDAGWSTVSVKIQAIQT